MKVNNIALCAAALALPLTALAPATSNAATAGSPSNTAVSHSATADSKPVTPAVSYKSPKLTLIQWQHTDGDDDYFKVQVSYKCFTKTSKWRKGELVASVDPGYNGETWAQCDGVYHKKWIKAERDADADPINDGDDFTWAATVTDPYGKSATDTDTDTL